MTYTLDKYRCAHSLNTPRRTSGRSTCTSVPSTRSPTRYLRYQGISDMYDPTSKLQVKNQRFRCAIRSTLEIPISFGFGGVGGFGAGPEGTPDTWSPKLRAPAEDFFIKQVEPETHNVQALHPAVEAHSAQHSSGVYKRGSKGSEASQLARTCYV